MLALTLSPDVGRAATGGPDAGGYTYVDSNEANGPDFAWTELSATGTRVLEIGDDSVRTVPIGFSFTMYGAVYTAATLGINGSVMAYLNPEL